MRNVKIILTLKVLRIFRIMSIFLFRIDHTTKKSTESFDVRKEQFLLPYFVGKTAYFKNLEICF